MIPSHLHLALTGLFALASGFALVWFVARLAHRLLSYVEMCDQACGQAEPDAEPQAEPSRGWFSEQDRQWLVENDFLVSHKSASKRRSR